MVNCSVSEPTDGADPPPGLAVNKQSTNTPTLPPGLSRSKQHPTNSPGRATAAKSAPDAAAASNAVTTKADTLLNYGASGPPTSQDTERQLRTLRKKIRQADATARKAATGQHLTLEEEEKLKKLAIWYVLECVCHPDNAVACRRWDLAFKLNYAACCSALHVAKHACYNIMTCM